MTRIEAKARPIQTIDGRARFGTTTSYGARRLQGQRGERGADGLLEVVDERHADEEDHREELEDDTGAVSMSTSDEGRRRTA